MDKQQVLAWQRGFELAREAEHELVRREPLDLNRSIRLALSLIELCRKQDSWSSVLDDPIRLQEVEKVRRRWSRLKEVGHR
jgi:hypothetical protein